MTKKALYTIICIYFIIGFIWLVAGTWVLNDLKVKHPTDKLEYLWDIKNTAFLLVSVVSIIYFVNKYYNNMLLKERSFNRQLQTKRNELKELVSIYKAVTLATNDVIWHYDIIKKELKWLNGYKEMFGYDDDTVESNSFWYVDKIHPDDRGRVRNTFKNLLENKEAQWSIEYRYKCKDGSYKDVLDRGYLILENNQPSKVIGAMQDITVRKSYRQQLESQNKKLKDIAWLNSHEIRRPLCNIRGLIPLLKKNTDNTEYMKELIFLLETSSNELDDVILKVNNEIA